MFNCDYSYVVYLQPSHRIHTANTSQMNVAHTFFMLYICLMHVLLVEYSNNYQSKTFHFYLVSCLQYTAIWHYASVGQYSLQISPVCIVFVPKSNKQI